MSTTALMIDGRILIPPFCIAMTKGLAPTPGALELMAFKRRLSVAETHMPTRKMLKT